MNDSEAAEKEFTKVTFALSRKSPKEKAHILRGLFLKSLYLHCRYGLKYQDVNPHTHGEMIRSLEENTRNKLIVMPRGTLKSSVSIVGYTTWLLNRNPNLRIFIDSKNYDNSKNFLREIRAHFEGNLMVSLFGQYKSDLWNESEIILQQRMKILKEPSVRALGIGISVTGQHCDVLLHDDMNTPENSGTLEACQKIIDRYKYNKSVLERLKGISAVVATRYSASDLIAHIINNEIPDTMKDEMKKKGFV